MSEAESNERQQVTLTADGETGRYIALFADRLKELAAEAGCTTDDVCSVLVSGCTSPFWDALTGWVSENPVPDKGLTLESLEKGFDGEFAGLDFAYMVLLHRRHGILPITRAEIIRGFITGVADSGVQLDTCLTERDIAKTISELLRKGAGAPDNAAQQQGEA